VRRRSSCGCGRSPRRAGWALLRPLSEFEATTGGTWRLAGCRDYWSNYEHPFHVSPTGNQHDAIDAVELALADYEAMFGHPMVEDCPVDLDTGELLPVVTIVTDNGGPFRSFRFEAFITAHPELAHVRTRVNRPEQNGSRERGFGTLKYERLYVEQAVETTAEEGWCPSCGVRARLHDRRPSRVRDLPVAGRPVTLVWVTRGVALP
jgi:hypothetical protein